MDQHAGQPAVGAGEHSPLDGEEAQETTLEPLITERPRNGRSTRSMWHHLLVIGDNTLILLLLALSLVVDGNFHLQSATTTFILGRWDTLLIWGVLALIAWRIAAGATQAQDAINASNRFRSAVSALFALILMLVFWTCLTYPFTSKVGAAYIGELTLFFVLAFPVLAGWRVALAALMNLPRFRYRSVIVGMNDAGVSIASELRTSKSSGMNVLGYIRDGLDERPATTRGIPVLGGRSALRYLSQIGAIDTVIMAVDYRSCPDLFQEALDAAQLGISVIPVTTAYERTSGKVPVQHIGDQWYLSLPSERVISPVYLCWQKVMDAAFGLLGSMVLLLILPLLATLIYLDSPGPIFYRQERMGLHGRAFRIYKFRSMRQDAEHLGSAQWAVADDPRVTRIGRFMRATHLDELPQVFNILRGEMSLIGPRPERQEFVSALSNTIPFYRCRLSVKPGLTGWAQVKYHYGNSDLDALIKLQYDLYYIKHQSFMLDIFIMLKTVTEVLFRYGT
jgi:exopolysaccharide biosynthesis polyprenyl glycosylphosphotransferase